MLMPALSSAEEVRVGTWKTAPNMEISWHMDEDFIQNEQ